MGNVLGISKAYPNGSRWLQKSGEWLTITSFMSGNTFEAVFDDGTKVITSGRSIKGGQIINYNTPSVCDVGYRGYGKYHAKVDNKNTTAYEVWRGIIRRCYQKDNDHYEKYHRDGITVSNEWHNFQNFAEWYYTQLNNLKSLENTKYDVDKDLKGGKEYSEDNCILLPYKLNNFIQNRVFSSGMGYINKSKHTNLITTTVSLLGKQVYIGLHETQEESDEAYNIAKNYVNRKMAESYLDLGLITKDTYDRILRTENKYTLEDERKLFLRRDTLKDRIDGLFVKKENLLQRCKYKVNNEIY